MPLVRYFTVAGSLLLALLFLADWYFPKLVAPPATAGVDKTIIRLHSAHRWPEADRLRHQPSDHRSAAGARDLRGAATAGPGRASASAETGLRDGDNRDPGRRRGAPEANPKAARETHRTRSASARTPRFASYEHRLSHHGPGRVVDAASIPGREKTAIKVRNNASGGNLLLEIAILRSGGKPHETHSDHRRGAVRCR